MFIIGKQEVENGTIDVRSREENSSIGKFTIGEILEVLKSHDPEKSKAWERVSIFKYNI